jgi:hypothetical protein
VIHFKVDTKWVTLYWSKVFLNSQGLLKYTFFCTNFKLLSLLMCARTIQLAFFLNIWTYFQQNIWFFFTISGKPILTELYWVKFFNYYPSILCNIVFFFFFCFCRIADIIKSFKFYFEKSINFNHVFDVNVY